MNPSFAGIVMLLTLRQRNARMEVSNVGADPEALLAALHAERETAEEETKRQAEQDEDDAMVARYFAKVATAQLSISNGANGKGKSRAVESDSAPPDDDDVPPHDASDSDPGSETELALPALPALTIKRRPPPSSVAGTSEPSVASILAAKGRTLDGPVGTQTASTAAQAAAKRKREGMQKLLGIKKKVKA